MPTPRLPRLALAATFAGGILVAIFIALLLRFRVELRDDIREKIIGRDAAVFFPVTLRQIAETEATAGREAAARPATLLAAVLKNAQQEGVFAVAIFDRDGDTLQSVPTGLPFVELPVDDYIQLLERKPISRYHPNFPLDQNFTGVKSGARIAPVLEVLLPLHGKDVTKLVGFARYYIDARPVAAELAAIDERIDRQTRTTLALGSGLIGGVVLLAALGLHRSQRTIRERNERLARTNFELTLAAKASALGQIASHLIHGLQGPVAGLRAVVAGRGAGQGSLEDWQSAAGYTERLQAMIGETVALLSDAGAQAHYEFTGEELATIIRDRNLPAATELEVQLHVGSGFASTLDSHRGGVLCLIAANLVQNAIAASPGKHVDVQLTRSAKFVVLAVADNGHGIPKQIRPHLFEPGRSGRPGGTGLGLAISRLLARQIDAELTLVRTGADGTVFRVILPVPE